MQPIHVIGLGLGREWLVPAAARLIDRAEVLAGGRRLIDLFPDHPGRRLPLAGPLDPWLDEVAAASETSRVVVLTSGDPGFYGVAARLAERVGRDRLVIQPNVPVAAAAFARLGLAWDDAVVASLHGRDEEALFAALDGVAKAAVYTDPANSPGKIARLLLERGQTDWRMSVLENLGGRDERIWQGGLAEAAETGFGPLNVVVLIRQGRAERPRLGAPEEAYQRQGGLVTKAEVRAVALAKLELGPGQTVWDLGAGCGSVGLEASLLTPGGKIIAVEARPERAADIEANRARYQVGRLEVVRAELPGCLAELPRPDRIFIGGGGEALAAIIEAAWSRLDDGGVMVAAAVRLAALKTAQDGLERLAGRVEVTQVQIARSAELAGDRYLKSLNPVWLIKGVKREVDGD